jgi:PqqD family protein of HPr-rel-A system
MTPAPQCAEGIEIVETPGGFVVYDPAHDRVHHLNHTAALVLEFATGENSEPEITRMLQAAYDLPQPPDDEVQQCLAQLREEGLIS